jgi:hypothetical protein
MPIAVTNSLEPFVGGHFFHETNPAETLAEARAFLKA